MPLFAAAVLTSQMPVEPPSRSSAPSTRAPKGLEAGISPKLLNYGVSSRRHHPRGTGYWRRVLQWRGL